MCTRRLSRTERGFTLIELLVVVLVLAILIAIAVPTLLAARRPANDRAAQSLARTGMLAARAILADRDTYAGLDATDLAATENTTRFLDDSSVADARQSEVSVASGAVGSSTYVILASRSASGRCFALLDWGDRAPEYQRVDTTDCRAGFFDASTGWGTEWP